MPTPHVLILRAPGTNCDGETAFAFERAGAAVERVHINRLLEEPGLARRFQVLCLPGGFSYGDDIAAGRILGSQIRNHLADCFAQFKAEGKLVLGICNGFQILMRSGILLAPDSAGGEAATLTNNASGKFEDRWVRLRVASSKCVFFAGIESMYLPVAHAEGRFVPRDEQTIARLDAAGQLFLRYQSQAGMPSGSPHAPREDAVPRNATEGVPYNANGDVPYPDNPNGAVAAVAGVCDETGRVCGLMPHPERHIDRTQHPRWTRGEGSPEGDGLAVFRNTVRYFA